MTVTGTTNPDTIERVLVAVKGLKDNFDKHYAEIESRVKKSVEGPVKTFTIEDNIPIVLQLSVWDTKLGPLTTMLVGETSFIDTIPRVEQDNSTRMMDVLAPGETCDLSKGSVNRLMIKFSIIDPNTRGGEAWLLIVVYYDKALAIPKAVIEDLLKEMASCWHDDAVLSVEAMGIRDHFNVATSRWKEYLMELRRSIWCIVKKATDPAPVKPGAAANIPDSGAIAKDAPDTSEPETRKGAIRSHVAGDPVKSLSSSAVALSPASIPSMSPATPALRATTAIGLSTPPAPAAESPQAQRNMAIPSVDNVANGTDAAGGTLPDIDLLDVITSTPANEPVKITLESGRFATSTDDIATPAIAHPAIAPSKMFSQPVESQVVDVLGKLQRSGFSVKVDKNTKEGSACRLVELDPGKPGVVALLLSFHAKFLSFPSLHVIDGKFYAGDDRVLIEPYRPAIKEIIAKHVPGSEELAYRKKTIGRLFKNRPLKPILVPVVLVRDSILDGTAKVPFVWIEPTDGVHGYFVLVAREIDRLDKFLMNVLRVLGGKLVMTEATHVDEVMKDIVATGKTCRILSLLTIAVGIIGLFSATRVLPIDAIILLQQYWYIHIMIVIALVGGMASTYNKLAKRVERRVSARVIEVAPRTPLLVKPTWDDLIDAARRIGKADFPAFRAAFCQDLDATAIDEAVEVVFNQDASIARPGTKKAADTFADLESAVPAAPQDAKPITNSKTSSRAPGLRVTEMGKQRRSILNDDNIAEKCDETDPIETPIPALGDRDEDPADKIDPLKVLSHKD